MLNAFKNFSIRLKLLCGFGVIGLLLVIIAGLAIVGMNRLNGNTEFIYKTNLVGVTVMSDLRAQMLRRSNFVVWHLLANDAATIASREKSIAELDKEIEDLLVKYAPLIVTEQERKCLNSSKREYPSIWKFVKNCCNSAGITARTPQQIFRRMKWRRKSKCSMTRSTGWSMRTTNKRRKATAPAMISAQA